MLSKVKDDAELLELFKHIDYSSTVLVLEDIGEILTPKDTPIDTNNYPWRITDIEGVINILKQINKGEI
jgi:hypothetical protein